VLFPCVLRFFPPVFSQIVHPERRASPEPPAQRQCERVQPRRTLTAMRMFMIEYTAMIVTPRMFRSIQSNEEKREQRRFDVYRAFQMLRREFTAGTARRCRRRMSRGSRHATGAAFGVETGMAVGGSVLQVYTKQNAAVRSRAQQR